LWGFCLGLTNEIKKEYPRLMALKHHEPIGRAITMKKRDSSLCGRFTFGEYLGDEIAKAVLAKHIDFDLGFIPIKSRKDGNVTIYEKIELVEISLFFNARKATERKEEFFGEINLPEGFEKPTNTGE
jgi:hypothetical protein